MMLIRTSHFAYYERIKRIPITPESIFDAKVIVRCVSTGIVILGPYFFKEEKCASRYTNMLQNFVMPLFLQRNALNDIVWMQDDAPRHIMKSVLRVHKQLFCDVII